MEKLQQLSRVAADSDAKSTTREYLSFRLGKEEYGIDILKVQEIRGYEEPTRMVNTPDFIKGVLNLRGAIVPILDMRVKFGLESVAFNQETVTIVLNIGQVVVGMVVDAVSDVVALSESQIRPAPEMGSTIATDYIVGIATITQSDQQRMLILMDIEKLMSSQDMGLIKQALQ